MKIVSYLPGDHPWQNTILHFDSLPSTNDYAKALAQQGAPEGTVVIAASQSAGRGRMGRSFHAPAGLGLYLSVILRPGCTPDKLMHLTCAAAKAACDGVESCTGIRPQVKWINDLILNGKKLGGILTEMSINTASGLVDWTVIGIGINCLHKVRDFPPEIREIATSLLLSAGVVAEPDILGSAIIQALYHVSQQLLTQKDEIMNVYKQDCMTLGKDVILIQGEKETTVTALDIDSDGGLIVRDGQGTISTVRSGEISVRGLSAYL